MISKKHIRILFILYLLILVKVIVFKYPLAQMQEIVAGWQKGVFWEGLSGANFELFKTIKMYIRYWDYKGLNSFGNLIGNVVAFIPFGFLLPNGWDATKKFWVCLLLGFLLVLGIELFQLFSAFGVFDVDDVLLNCVGVTLGFIFYKMLKLFKPESSLIK